MNYLGSDSLTLSRDVEVVAVPAGHSITLPKGTEVAITQALGGSYTLMVPTYGGLFRLADKDADAIGKEPHAQAEASAVPLEGEALEKEVWQRLKTCYDPEIPVNIVDLGLIYSMEISPIEQGKRVDVKMTLTAQGCGMGGSIAADAQNKLLDIPGVKEADVQVVWDPPWGPEKISAEGRTLLGIR
ncbi:MAG TPA: putative Fe-S cluster assembly protein SufT [Terriglobia bacterium]|nr:putative Fe-S cluster assembly protein SufT [Terriglobia bacterium]